MPDLVDPDAVGVVGHSLGAITVLGLRNDTCCTDPDIKAVVAVAGMTLPFAGSPVTAGAAPLLLVHSGTDPTVPVGGSEFADHLRGDDTDWSTLQREIGAHSIATLGQRL